jgi:hypothetical protein
MRFIFCRKLRLTMWRDFDFLGMDRADENTCGAPTGKPVGRNPEQEPPAKAGARVEGSVTLF